MVNVVAARPVGLVLGRLNVGVAKAGRRKLRWPSGFCPSAMDQVLRSDPVLAAMMRGPR